MLVHMAGTIPEGEIEWEDEAEGAFYIKGVYQVSKTQWDGEKGWGKYFGQSKNCDGMDLARVKT